MVGNTKVTHENSLENQLLEFAGTVKKFQTSEAISFLNRNGIKSNRSYLSRKLGKMVKKGLLIREGYRNKTFYALSGNTDVLNFYVKKTFDNNALREHEVSAWILEDKLFQTKLGENLRSIFEYAFTEMLNNAIEHSRTKKIQVCAKIESDQLVFAIEDYGIGVFRNVMGERQLKSELEAMQDILKGRLTTMPASHSGEGIFFTSKVADLFLLESYGRRLRVDNNINDTFFETILKTFNGTRVTFIISINSQKHLTDIFREYTSAEEDFSFNKTKQLVKLYTLGSIYISRSQARRLLSGLETFKHIVLDFDKVSTVGQAFVDEVFRVFKNTHPEIEVTSINMNENVAFMLGRVQKV